MKLEEGAQDRSARAILFGWSVHALTASGAILAFLALMAVHASNWHLALFWLLLAMLIDGVDGTLARRARVTERVPRIDGPSLDLVVDFLTYVFVPVVFLWQAELVPPPFVVPAAAMILLSSLYLFVRTDMKTEDNYFRGFPSLWNLVVFYLFVAQLAPIWGAVVVCLLSVLTFAPVHFVHPFRVRDFQPWLLLLSLLWSAASLALLWPGWSASLRDLLFSLSAGAALLLVAMGLVRSVRGPK